MTESADECLNANSLSAKDVMAFLQQQPEFFNQHPEVLHDLKLPHVNGEAISLFDRQLASLRDENRRLKSNQKTMIENARANEMLIKRIHALALKLMEATGPAAIFSTLRTQLKEDFNADRVALLIFATPSFVEREGPSEFIGSDDSRFSAFEDLSSGESAMCGEISEAHTHALWPEESSLNGSGALLPLNAKSWRGVLAIQSDQRERFAKEMGTEFLSYISDIVCLVVDPWVAREPR